MTPIHHPTLCQQLAHVFRVNPTDTDGGWEMQPDGIYEQLWPTDDEPIRNAQATFMTAARNAAEDPRETE